MWCYNFKDNWINFNNYYKNQSKSNNGWQFGGCKHTLQLHIINENVGEV